MSDNNVEIERKFLLDKSLIPFDLSTLESLELEQFYISFFPSIRARKVNDGEKYIITVKSKTDNSLVRKEIETEISEAEYDAMIKMHAGNIIRKKRYLSDFGNGLTGEIDIFEGDLTGLAYLEIEFPDTDTANSYKAPDWITEDVTDDPRFTNGYLAEHGITF